MRASLLFDVHEEGDDLVELFFGAQALVFFSYQLEVHVEKSHDDHYVVFV